MQIESDFRAIASDSALRSYLATYQFSAVAGEPRWNLGTYRALHDGRTFQLRYRWYDPSQAFSPQRDVHKAELMVASDEGSITLAEVSFEE